MSVQSANGASTKSQEGASFPLLDGCPSLTNPLQALCVSYLNYSNEVLSCLSLKQISSPQSGYADDEFPLCTNYDFYNAKPGEATIDRLCARTFSPLEQLETIKRGHNRPYFACLQISGQNPSPKQDLLLQACDHFGRLTLTEIDFSNKELQELLKSKKIDVLILQKPKLKRLCPTLPQIKGLTVDDCDSLDLRECTSLKQVRVTQFSHGGEIDIRGLRCSVLATSKNGPCTISIRVSDPQEKERLITANNLVRFDPKKDGA